MMLQADKALVGQLSAALTALDMGRIKDAKDLVEQAVTFADSALAAVTVEHEPAAAEEAE